MVTKSQMRALASAVIYVLVTGAAWGAITQPSATLRQASATVATAASVVGAALFAPAGAG